MRFLIRRCDRRTVVAVVACVLAAWTGVADAQTAPCANPLFVQRTSVDANVLVMFDNSGSMNEAMYHDDYDPAVTYAGRFATRGMYYIYRSGWYRPSRSSRVYAYLVRSDQGRPGRYLGNYLNWIYYVATPQQRSEIPRVTRIQVAKVSVGALIDQTDGVRFGIMKFNYDRGGTLVAGIGTDKGTLLSRLNAIAGDSWTPLAETMVSAMRYLEGDGASAPIQYSCQKTFLIVITDGYPTKDLDVPGFIGDYDNDGSDPGDCQSVGTPYSNSLDCSDYMDDVALYLFENDLRPDLNDMQNVTTYTIGFNIDAGILQDTALNGGGLYFSADNAAELQSSLTGVLNDIISKKSSGTAVSIVSTEGAAEDRLYRAKFKPGEWRGFLEAYELPYQDGAPPLWRAGDKLKNRNPYSRKIYTSVDGTSRMQFKTAKVATLMPYLGTADRDFALDIIKFVRGEDLPGYRDRGDWKLGDIVHSSPVVVGSPAHFYDYLDYRVFRNDNSSRNKVIYVGANDGMMHCFNTATGKEMWAYIPKSQLGRLDALLDPGYCHSYYVDLMPKIADVHINGSWKTILIGGHRQGGSGYFALDITDPRASKMSVLWDIELPVVQQSWSVPEIARDITLDKHVIFVGSGPDSVNGEAHLVALDPADGSTLWSELLSTSSGMNMAASPVIIDRDSDGYDDVLYVSDLAGHVWRVDLAAYPWTKSLVFQTDQPIQAEPVLTVDEFGNVLLYFGTGRYMTPDDIDDTSLQTFYCVIDDQSGVAASRFSLVDQTYSINPVSGLDRGWYIDLVRAPGERVTTANALAAGTIYFTSFQPRTEICAAGGVSWFYNVDFLDGSTPDNDDGTENDTTDDRVEDLGDGIYSDPVFDLANEEVIVQSSDTTLRVKDARGVIRRIIVRSWRQLFD